MVIQQHYREPNGDPNVNSHIRAMDRYFNEALAATQRGPNNDQQNIPMEVIIDTPSAPVSSGDNDGKQTGNIRGNDETLGQRLQAQMDFYAQAATTPSTSIPETQTATQIQTATATTETVPDRQRRLPPTRTNERESTSRSTRRAINGASLPPPPPPNYQLSTRDQKRPRRNTQRPQRPYAAHVFAIERQHEEEEEEDDVYFPGAYAMPGPGIITPSNDDSVPISSPSREDSSIDDGTWFRSCGTFLKNRTKRRWVSLSIVAVMVVVVTATAAMILTSNKNRTSNSIDTHSLDDDRLAKVWRLVQHYSPNNPAFDDPVSAHSKALHWLVYEDLMTPDVVSNVISRDRSDSITARYVLALFYFSTGGGGSSSSWSDDYHFLSPSLHECNWTSTSKNHDNNVKGVTCNKFSEVTGIVIESNGLHGTIPKEISLLKAIEVLRLRNNQLTGLLPIWEIGNTAPFFRELDVSVNQLSEGATAAFYVTSMIELNVSHNRFYGPVFREVSRTRFSERMETLDMSNCSFSGRIKTNDLRNLRTFKLDDNSFTGTFPTDLNKFSALSIFSASGNKLSGTFPWTNLEQSLLTRVEMSNNNFTNIFPPLSIHVPLWTSLEHLDFSNNWVKSTIPESIGQLSMLKNLLVGDNRLTGTVPSILGDVPFLQTLDLSHNHLEGSLPSELGNCKYLKDLLLNDNLFVGTIPHEFSQITSLNRGTFHANDFSGDIGFLCPAATSEVVDNSSTIGTLTADCLGNSPDVDCPPTCCECYN